MDDYILTCLVDILNACKEVELFFADKPQIFEEFKHNTMKIRAVERNVEIMGEAMGRIAQRDEKFLLPESKAIIQTRNRVIHGYDSVTPEFLWSLVIKHIPALKKDIENMIEENNCNIIL